MSNVKERADHKSEKRAALTVRELGEWLTLEIAGRYHHNVHRGIHMTPRRRLVQGNRQTVNSGSGESRTIRARFSTHYPLKNWSIGLSAFPHSLLGPAPE